MRKSQFCYYSSWSSTCFSSRQYLQLWVKNLTNLNLFGSWTAWLKLEASSLGTVPPSYHSFPTAPTMSRLSSRHKNSPFCIYSKNQYSKERISHGLIFPLKSLEFIYLLKQSQLIPQFIVFLKGLLSFLPQLTQFLVPFLNCLVHLAEQLSVVLGLTLQFDLYLLKISLGLGLNMRQLLYHRRGRLVRTRFLLTWSRDLFVRTCWLGNYSLAGLGFGSWDFD